MDNPVIRGRFAPSPSGRMHLGNVLSMLLAWLSAKSAGRSIVLRIEDLDPARCRPEYAARLEDDLLWLGLDWDEGGSRGGPHAPYFQSRRTALYARAFDTLFKKGLVYPCFCSRDELHAANAPHASDGRVLYDGRCRRLSPSEITQKGAGRKPAMRLVVGGEAISFADGCCGQYTEIPARDCGDFIIRRSDGVYAYQLAVVVDDAAMGITQVVRGRDLLSSTPRQIYLYRLLGLEPPAFFHIPLLLAPDGRRLSKRERDLDLGCLRKCYAGPEPILGRLAHLCRLTAKEEPISAQELIPLFSWDKIPQQDLIVPPGFL